MTKCIFPGSFDPVTKGHVDIIKRAVKIFGRVTVAILKNNSKQSMFDFAERVAFLKLAIGEDPNVEIEEFDGLLVDFCRKKKCTTVIRGLRNSTDFEYETYISAVNKSLYPEIEVVMLTTNPDKMHISSKIVRELLQYHGDLTEFVPDGAKEEIQRIYLEKKLR